MRIWEIQRLGNGPRLLIEAIAGYGLWLLVTCAGANGGPTLPGQSRPEFISPALPHQQAENAVARTVYVGCSVTKFKYRNSLVAWEHSRDLIGRALGHWSNCPPPLQIKLTEPTAEELANWFTNTIPSMLRPNDQLVVYLGTHHLKDGRLLLANGDAIFADDLAEWLNALAQPVVLIADVCYAEALEHEASFGEHVLRIHASAADELAPDISLDGRFKTLYRFLRSTDHVVRGRLGMPHDEYSLLGYSFVHALNREMIEPRASVAWPRLFERMRSEQRRLRKVTRQTRMPLPVGRNLYASAFKAAMFTIEDDEPKEKGPDPFVGIKEMLARPDNQLEIGEANLLIGKIYKPSLQVDKYTARLDELADEVKRRIGKSRSPQKVIDTINTILFAEQGFSAVERPYAEDFLLHELLDKKRGRCVAFVSLYLAIGERLGLPFVSVCVPEHIFTRWVPGAPGSDKRYRKRMFKRQSYINVETTLEGKALDDTHYHGMLGSSVSDKGQSFYMRGLSQREMIAVLLSPLGSALRDRDRLDEALAACKLGLTIVEHDAEAWNNLGMVYRQKEQPDLARAAYRRALEVHPGFAEVYNNLGVLAATPEERLVNFRKAVELKKDLPGAWQNLSYAYFEQANFQMAWACALQCRRLGLQLPHEYVDSLRNKLDQ